MGWFSENYKWLFDGFAGAAVLAVIGYVLHHFRGSRNRQGAATLTAQGAKVESSPVASGSGITQTINSPTTINVSLPGTSAPATPLRFFNFDGSAGPLFVSGKQHSVHDSSLVDLTCLVTIVNYTQYPLKIAPQQLFLNGAEWPVKEIFFRPKSNPLNKFDRISLTGNNKEDHELHFMFAAADWPKARSGYVVMDTDAGEAIHVEVRFP
jgi:hypothetical protein